RGRAARRGARAPAAPPRGPPPAPSPGGACAAARCSSPRTNAPLCGRLAANSTHSCGTSKRGHRRGAAAYGAVMPLLEGRRLLVTGVLTDRSIAYAVAAGAQREGAEVVLTGFGRSLRLTERIARRLPHAAD